MDYIEWSDLNREEREQVVTTYKNIREEEEEREIGEVDIEIVKSCRFFRSKEWEDYIEVEI